MDIIPSFPLYHLVIRNREFSLHSHIHVFRKAEGKDGFYDVFKLPIVTTFAMVEEGAPDPDNEKKVSQRFVNIHLKKCHIAGVFYIVPDAPTDELKEKYHLQYLGTFNKKTLVMII